jgi:KDO2-lipid IV(A) lauroyltransferase
LKKFVIINSEEMRKKFAPGRGIVFVGGHFGNWEIMAYGGAAIFGKPLNVIVKEQKNRALDRRINMVRQHNGNRMIEMKKAPREVFKALQDNEIVAFLSDQSAPAESVRINFFGKELTAFEGPASFALKTGAPVFFGVPFRDDEYNYSLRAIEVDTAKYGGYSQENVRALTQELNSLLEEHIIMKPGHWLWFHKRFKSVLSYG